MRQTNLWNFELGWSGKIFDTIAIEMNPLVDTKT